MSELEKVPFLVPPDSYDEFIALGVLSPKNKSFVPYVLKEQPMNKRETVLTDEERQKIWESVPDYLYRLQEVLKKHEQAVLAKLAEKGEIVITKNEAGQIVAVTRQDEEGRILEVLAESKLGDIVLDPFIGSGTTAQVALQHGRQYLGCELNQEYQKLQQERIQGA